MKEVFVIILLVIVFISCLGVKTLPYLRGPYVEKIVFVEEIMVEGERIEKREMKKPRVQPVILLKLRNIEGRSHVELKVYREKKLIRSYHFSFGEESKFYSEVIIWRKLNCIDKAGSYLVAVFLNDQLISFQNYTIRKQ